MLRIGLLAALPVAASLAIGGDRAAGNAERREPAPSFISLERVLAQGSQWLEAPPTGLQQLKGKVVLVNFWTYTCINSSRALPYVREWAAKYKDRGLVVVGVHTPEFAFEKDLPNVRTGLKAAGVVYPTVTDNDYRIWRSFKNQAWPAFYFVDAEGRVRGRMLGEGDYDKAERLLQQLLSEASGTPVTDPIRPIVGEGVQAPPDWQQLRSPETYLGYLLTTNFASPGGLRNESEAQYKLPATLPLNHWGLGGSWVAGEEFTTLKRAGGKIAYRFHARDLHLVLGPSASGASVRFRVTVDGKPPAANHGVDVDATGRGTVREPRMYQLIRQAGSVEDRTVEIEFLDPGVRAYDFTFG